MEDSKPGGDVVGFEIARTGDIAVGFRRGIGIKEISHGGSAFVRVAGGRAIRVRAAVAPAGGEAVEVMGNGGGIGVAAVVLEPGGGLVEREMERDDFRGKGFGRRGLARCRLGRGRCDWRVCLRCDWACPVEAGVLLDKGFGHDGGWA
jgi:hypothetical protein